VQGEEAEKSIAAALLALRGRSDLIIVCRGGGSTEDLWCFNSEMVARAIFACDVPVISAVGHETDVTVADHVADARAATPTAAAKMAVPDLEEVQEALKYTKVRMMRALWTTLERAEDRLGHLQHVLSARRMYSLARDSRQRLDYLSQKLEGAEAGRLKSHKSRLELLAGRLGAVGPQETLQRGYAIARSGKGLIVKATDVRPGEDIELILSQGRLYCRVLECRNDEEAML
jgi:exodeoxyribonuclease VII large subunit